MESVVDSLTRVRYVAQDFQTYENESKEFLQTEYPDEYNDYVDANMGMALIQQSAYANQGLAFYMNRRTTDLYMPTAQSPNAISKIARMLNYTIEGSSVSSVDLTVTLKNGSYSFPVYIEKGFKFSGPNGLEFEYRNDNPIIYNPGETEKTITVYEGSTLTNVFISDGTENQKFSLIGIPEDRYLVGASITMLVGNEEWTEKNQIPYSIGNFYEVDYVSTPPTIKVGDGIAGTIPEEGKEIRIEFIVGSGKKGRVGSNQITKEVAGLVIRNEKIPLVITNERPSAGGDDREDLRKVKVLSPQFFQSQDRAISKIDYDAIANTYPGVAKADAQIVRGVSGDVSINFYLDSMRNAVSGCASGVIDDIEYLTNSLYTYLDSTLSTSCSANIVQVALLQADANNNYVSPSTGLTEEIRAHLQERADAVHVVKTIDGSVYLVPVDLSVRIKVSKNAVEEDVITRARDALLKYDTQPYGLLVLRNYGESLYVWEINKSIRDVQLSDSDIEYADIDITGPSDKVSVTGNLVIDDNEIIVPNTITVESIVI